MSPDLLGKLMAAKDAREAANKGSSLPPLPEGPYEMYVPYSAWRAQGRFRHKVRQEATLRKDLLKLFAFMAIVYAFVYFLLPTLLGVFPFFKYFGVWGNLLIYTLLAILSYPVVTAPTNLQIGAEGIKMHWLTSFGQLSSPWISFDYIDYVTVSNFRRGYYKSRAIDLYIDKSSVPAHVRRALRFMAPSLWCVSFGDKLKLRLDIAAITHEADLPLMLRAFKNLLPAEKLGPEVLEIEEQHPGQSFTKLWLDNLDGGDRQRLTMGPLEPGETVFGGRYEIVRRLAAGGQAVTYLAQDLNIATGDDQSLVVSAGGVDGTAGSASSVAAAGTVLVLKEFVLPVRGGMEIRKRALENVEHEAKLLEKLDNERIVKMLDCFVDGQRAYLVLEYIDGKSLRKLVQDEGALPESDVLRLAIEMCTVLEYLHAQMPAIIHRDFTPENLLLRSRGTIALIDFNVAEQLESKETKTMVGKHCYVAPEQFRGKATAQSDVYACGCTLYWLLTGEDPEPISTSHPALKNEKVSEAMDRVVALATQIDVSKRFISAAAMKDELLKLVR